MTDTKPAATENDVAILDLSTLDLASAAEQSFEFELVHPVSKKGLGMYISVVGKDSDTYRDHIRDRTNTRIRKQHNTMRRGQEIEPMTFEELEQDDIDLLAACTTGWRNVKLDGPLAFTPENAKKLYRRLRWVRDQVNQQITDIENFMQG